VLTTNIIAITKSTPGGEQIYNGPALNLAPAAI